MKRNNILLTIAALLMLCGCSKETDSGPGGGLPMRVVPSLEGDTKAGMQTADLQEFYLQLGCDDAAYAYFGKVSKSGAAWSATKQLLWKDETTPVSVCAAYFGGHAFTAAEFSGGVALAVPADQSTPEGLNGADLLTRPAASIKYEDTTVGELPVALNHGLAKVNFVITLGDAVYDAKIGLTDNPITAFTVKGANTGFNFKPQTGTVTVTAGTQADITPLAGTYTPGTITAKTSTAVFEAILVPQSFAAGELSVTFSIGKGDYAWSNTDAITLAVGKTYNLPVSVTTAPPVEPYNAHESVDMGNGLKWATCNVGATNPWDYGDYFAWGETAPKSEYNWGTYQWMEANSSSWKRITKYTFADNQKDGTLWYEGDTFIGDGYTSLADDNYADDAARANWGGDWRTPTDAEWTWLLDGNNCTWEWTHNYDGKGVTGRIVTSKVNGNQIFLPAAGYRKDADLRSDGSYGSYWSSSLYEIYSNGARGVDFNSGGVYRGFGNRYNGLSVRPVTE